MRKRTQNQDCTKVQTWEVRSFVPKSLGLFWAPESLLGPMPGLHVDTEGLNPLALEGR